MTRILIAYYSLTGHTRQVAEALGAACGADIEEIRELEPRKFSRWGLFWWGWEALRGASARIRPARHDPGAYDIVIVGTPVWAGRMSSPVRAWLKAHGAEIKELAVFCTQGGRGGEEALQQMADLAGLPTIERLVVSEPEIAAQSYKQRLGNFLGPIMADARV